MSRSFVRVEIRVVFSEYTRPDTKSLVLESWFQYTPRRDSLFVWSRRTLLV